MAKCSSKSRTVKIKRHGKIKKGPDGKPLVFRARAKGCPRAPLSSAQKAWRSTFRKAGEKCKPKKPGAGRSACMKRELSGR